MCELKTFDNGVALIIGVGADLPMTVVDATAIKDILIDPERAAYKSDNVKLLTEENATKDKILSSFQNLIDNTEEDDTVIIYYSGHGGVDQQTNEYYLVPFGFKPDDRSKTGISAQELSDLINSVKSKKLIVFLDCCHAGGMVIRKDIQDTKLLSYIKSDSFNEKAPTDLIAKLDEGSGRFFIASSQENEYSIAATPYSIFTECLIKALAGAGTVENDEGYAKIFDITGYLLDSVPKRSKDFPPYQRRQNPVVKSIENATNFPICYYAGGNTKKSPLPDEPSPVFTDSQTQNLTIYGVIYERINNELRPAVDAKVKIPVKESFTRTNQDGNFLLTDVPKHSNKLDVRWNNSVNLLPIKDDGIYELKNNNSGFFNYLIKTFLEDEFWKKGTVLLVGLIALLFLAFAVIFKPVVVSCENRFIQIFIAALVGLYSALVLFFFVPPSTKYKNSITIVTSTGFMLAIIALFSNTIKPCNENVAFTGYILFENGMPVHNSSITIKNGAFIANPITTDPAGKFTIEIRSQIAKNFEFTVLYNGKPFLKRRSDGTNCDDEGNHCKYVIKLPPPNEVVPIENITLSKSGCPNINKDLYGNKYKKTFIFHLSSPGIKLEDLTDKVVLKLKVTGTDKVLQYVFEEPKGNHPENDSNNELSIELTPQTQQFDIKLSVCVGVLDENKSTTYLDVDYQILKKEN